jgi:hypothetical protein
MTRRSVNDKYKSFYDIDNKIQCLKFFFFIDDTVTKNVWYLHVFSTWSIVMGYGCKDNVNNVDIF